MRSGRKLFMFILLVAVCLSISAKTKESLIKSQEHKIETIVLLKSDSAAFGEKDERSIINCLQ